MDDVEKKSRCVHSSSVCHVSVLIVPCRIENKSDRNSFYSQVNTVESKVEDLITDEATTRNILDVILTAPHGVLRMVPGLQDQVSSRQIQISKSQRPTRSTSPSPSPSPPWIPSIYNEPTRSTNSLPICSAGVPAWLKWRRQTEISTLTRG